MKAMVKIKILTTLRNQEHLDGLAKSSTEAYVPEDYAEELVEEKGYAKYVSGEFKLVETEQGKFPEGFLEEDIPEGFPSKKLHSKLQSNDIHTFMELASYKDYSFIEGIGDKFSEKIEHSLEVASKDWKSKNQ